jgi:hypothetical protein
MSTACGNAGIADEQTVAGESAIAMDAASRFAD